MARVNFADVEDQKEFDVLPAGKYALAITDLTEREAGSGAKNPGARILRWEFEVASGEYANRKVWDNQACTENAMWKPKALLTAVGVDTDDVSYDFDEKQFYIGDDVLDMSEIVGQQVEGSIGIRPANKDKATGKDYPKQNRINAFHVYEASDEDLLS